MFQIFNNAIISSGSLNCNEGAAVTMARTFNTLVFLFLFTYFLHVNIKQQSTTEASVRARFQKARVETAKPRAKPAEILAKTPVKQTTITN